MEFGSFVSMNTARRMLLFRFYLTGKQSDLPASLRLDDVQIEIVGLRLAFATNSAS